MKIIQTSDSKYLNEIIYLYIEAFSEGQSQQYIDLENLNQYIKLILKEGYAHIAFENEKIIGTVLLCPLILDKDLPLEISKNFNIMKCIYVAEIMVKENARGKGIGKRLLQEFFENVDKNRFTDAFIRVWDQNTPAISLYEKMGFTYLTSIVQTKTKVDQSGTFDMNKIYLHKKIN
jgi:ribosomal protein S18 acetylase RimI-like enzyme